MCFCLHFSILFRLVMPYGHGLAFLLTNMQHIFFLKTIIFNHAFWKYYWDNTVFYKKWLNLNTTGYVCFFMYTAHIGKYSTLTNFTVYNIWLVNFIDFIEFYDFQCLVLENYLADFNEIYTHYRGGYVHTNFQAILNFHKNLRNVNF